LQGTDLINIDKLSDIFS